MSWSRYTEQLESWFESHLEPGWTGRVAEMRGLLERGEAVSQMMQVTGEEGVTAADFVTQQQALFVDMVYLQQDAFDAVDSSVSLDRQKVTFNKVYDLVTRNYDFADKGEARDYFTRLTGLFKNFHYAREDAPDYDNLLRQIDDLATSKTVVVSA